MTTKLEAYALETMDKNLVECITIIQKIGGRVKVAEHEKLCQMAHDMRALLNATAQPAPATINPATDKYAPPYTYTCDPYIVGGSK